MISAYINYQLAGLWDLVWMFGLGGVLVLACLAAAWFSPVGKKDFVWLAIVFAVATFVFGIGVTTGEKRVHAQWDQAKSSTLDIVKKARAGAVRDVARKPSKWLRHDRPDPDQRD